MANIRANSPTLTVRLTADISSFNAQLDRASERLRTAGESMQKFGETMTKYVSLPLSLLAGASLKAYMDIDALKKGLESVTGSSEAAGAEFEKLRESAKLPGLGLEEAVRGSINLQAIGFSADKARKYLETVGTAIAQIGGGRENFDLAVRGLSQLSNSAKPMQQDLYQIANQLPQVNKLLTDTFGTNRAEDLAALGLSGKQLADILINELGKIEPITTGLKNSWENFLDTLKISMADFGGALSNAGGLAEMLDTLSNAISGLVEWFTRLSPTTQKVIIGIAAFAAIIPPLVAGLGVFVGTILPAMITGLTTLGTIFGAIFSPISLIIAAVAALAAGLLYLYDNWEAVTDRLLIGFQHVKNAIIDVFLYFLKFNVFGLFIDGVNALLDAMGADKIGNPFNYLTERLEGLKTPISTSKREFKSFGESMSNVWDMVAYSLGIYSNKAKAASTANDVIAESANNATTAIEKEAKAIETLNTSIYDMERNKKSPEKDTSGLPPLVSGSVVTEKQLEESAKKLEEFETRVQTINSALYQGFTRLGDSIVDSFGRATTGAGRFLREMAKVALELISIKLAESLATTIANATMSAAGTGPLAIFTEPTFIAAGIAGVLGAFAAIPKFADGGIISGETLGIMGEYSGAWHNPEVVAPLDKLQGMLKQDTNQNFAFSDVRIKGDDIYLAVRRANQKRSRIY